VTAQVRLSEKAMPKVNEATDALTGERLPITDNTITISLPPMQMRLVAVN
jgi:hypothetical protein